MRLRSLSIRTYLLFSYLALILVLLAGMVVVEDYATDVLLARSMETSEAALKEATADSVKASEEVLIAVGEYIIRDKAQDAARELAYVLPKKPPYNYAQMRRDPRLRKIAVQTIQTPRGPVGYTDLYDQDGYILFHPDPSVEGRNQLDWQDEYPETTELIKRSFTENDVSGYFTFFDKEKRERKKYSVRVHIPGTPFIVGAVVNIDEFFLPTQKRLQAFSKEITAKAGQVLREQEKAINLQFRNGIIIAGLALCLMGGLGGLWFAAVISRPLRRLDRAVHQVGEGDFSVAVPERGVKEVVYLAQSFNQLGQQLTDYIEKRDFIRDTFGRYVTQEVVKKLLESKEALEMGGETREVSLLMSDLRGFTAIIAAMEPEQVITFLNRYLSRMIEILTDHRAVIDEILGDGILAFFGAPEPMEDHPARAVACALQMQAAMDEINALNEADGLPHLEMGIGVNTGRVVVGNIGSEQRAKYSVVGSDVNFASRMEGFALPGQVLISTATYNRVKDRVEVQDEVKVEMKGVPEAATLYDIRGIGAPYHIRLRARCDELLPLPEPVPVQLACIKDKIICGTTGKTFITHLCDTAARVQFTGELTTWEDVRLNLLDKRQWIIHGDIYGKVTQIKPLDGGRFEAAISFTSVAPEMQQLIQKIVAAA